MEQLKDIPVAVLVFHAEGCESCEEYLPRLRETAARWGSCVPTYLMDVALFPVLANAAGVEYTPTTVVSRYGRISKAKTLRIETGADTPEIEALYNSLGASCGLEDE